MVPKKSKDLYETTANQLGHSKDLVKDVVEMYWSDVRKALTDMKFHAIFIDNLGTFKAKETRLTEAKEKYERLSKYNDGSTFRKMSMKNELDSRVEKINNLLSLIEGDKVKKQTIKAKRDAKYDQPNMEEQVVNPRGSHELDTQERTSRESIFEEDEDM